MHQHDILVFVADKSADWQTFSYYVNQNNKKCEKDASSSSSFISKGSSNDGLTAFSSLSLSLGPGSFYYVVGNFDNNNKCDMTLTATVVADDKPTTDTPNPISNTTNSTPVAPVAPAVQVAPAAAPVAPVAPAAPAAPVAPILALPTLSSWF
ncbi:11820_t:CDS:2 [Ambispora gerdemannii]|uniref:11820_t:CDS:1 n=1 Tax=Ambispora gerdemannii TaxID=144530 RepID=A0A9N9BA22_9GLOM|nr:11820_t:CDS:2 [Ambispora gerdemannii]